MILDIGPDTAERCSEHAADRRAPSSGTARSACSSSSSSARARAPIAQAIARSKAFSLAGGGDTLAAIEKYGVEDGISYISTGGGAFLEFVEGKTLPAVAVLEQRARELRPIALMLQRTKIVATLGPATDDPRWSPDMMQAGLDVGALNASHGTRDSQRRRVEMVREAARERRPLRRPAGSTWPDRRSASRAFATGKVHARRGRAVHARHRARSRRPAPIDEVGVRLQGSAQGRRRGRHAAARRRPDRARRRAGRRHAHRHACARRAASCRIARA